MTHPKPPKDQHQPLIWVKSCGWAYDLKQLVYHHNPGVISVRVDAVYDHDSKDLWTVDGYVVMVQIPQNMNLRAVLINAIQNYPAVLRSRCFGMADRSLRLRPFLVKKKKVGTDINH